MESLIESIKKNEGWVPNAYKCPAGYWTIGYGFRVDYLPEDRDWMSYKMSEDEGDTILRSKVQHVLSQLRLKYDWFREIPQEVQYVIIEMSYQMGIVGFGKFKKTIKYLREWDFIAASNEVLDSKAARKYKTRFQKYSSKLYDVGVRTQ